MGTLDSIANGQLYNYCHAIISVCCVACVLHVCYVCVTCVMCVLHVCYMCFTSVLHVFICILYTSCTHFIKLLGILLGVYHWCLSFLSDAHLVIAIPRKEKDVDRCQNPSSNESFHHSVHKGDVEDNSAFNAHLVSRFQ